MGRYIDYEDVIDRYPELNTLGGADTLSSTYIVYSESFVDGLLSDNYTVPFSNNNMIVRDLAIDCCYWRAARNKIDDAANVQSAFYQTIAMIKKGQLNMVDDTGAIIPGIEKNKGLVSTTQSYHSAFGMRPVDEWHIDTDLISDERDRSNG